VRGEQHAGFFAFLFPGGGREGGKEGGRDGEYRPEGLDGGMGNVEIEPVRGEEHAGFFAFLFPEWTEEEREGGREGR